MTRLLVICADGMEWSDFETRTQAGDAPRLSHLGVAGVVGWLSGAPPGLGPAAAATLVTGVQPEVHGVWRAEEAWPGGLRPIGKTAWRVQPLWARLEAAGISTGSVGWPATRHGADWPGLHIDDSFPDSSGRTADAWAAPRNCVAAVHREAICARRVHVSQISGAMLAPLVPAAAFDDPDAQGAVHAMRAAVARAATVQSAAVWMLADRHEPAPDAVFIHQPILQQARRTFRDAVAPGVPGAIAGAWRFLDGLIGRLADIAGPGSLVLIVSPGGSGAPGVILAAGAGVARTKRFDGANLLDIAPTILARFGLADPALTGRALEAVASPTEMRTAPSPRQPGRLMPNPLMMAPLRRLGYRPPPPPSPSWTAAGLGELAVMLLDRDPIRALAAADAALAIDPDMVTALRVKIRAHVALQQPEPLEAVAERLDRLAPKQGWSAATRAARHVLRGENREALPFLKAAEADIEIDNLLTVGTLLIAAGRPANAARVFGKVLALYPGNVTAEIALAMAASARRDFLTAEAGLNRARAREPGRPAIWLQLAQVYAKSGRKGEAERMAATARGLGASPALAEAAAAGRLPV